MVKKKKHFNTQETIKELVKSKGLPERISTEAQLWDEIFKKEAFLMPDQFFPLIQEIHKKSYPNEVSVRLLATEYPVERVKTKTITSIRSDVTLLVGGWDIYHFECEISNDRAMVLRMFEYDAHVALEYHRLEPDARQSGTCRNTVLPFPHSAVLYLQDNKNNPDRLSCRIWFPDGSTYEYTAAAVRVLYYSLEEIHKKHLNILIPFLPLQFRKRLLPNPKTSPVKKEELTSFYQNIILILNEEIADGYLNEDIRKIILSLLRKSMVRVFYKDEELLEEVVKMTEPILELEFEIMEQFAKEMAEQIAQKMAGPMAKQMAKPIAKQMAESMAKQMAEPMAKQMAEPMAKQMAEPMAKQMAEPMAKQMAEPMAKQMAEPMAKQMAEPMAKQIAEPIVEQQAEQIKRELKQELKWEYKKSMEELASQKDKEIAALKKQIWLLQNPQNQE